MDMNLIGRVSAGEVSHVVPLRQEKYFSGAVPIKAAIGDGLTVWLDQTGAGTQAEWLLSSRSVLTYNIFIRSLYGGGLAVWISNGTGYHATEPDHVFPIKPGGSLVDPVTFGSKGRDIPLSGWSCYFVVYSADPAAARNCYGYIRLEAM